MKIEKDIKIMDQIQVSLYMIFIVASLKELIFHLYPKDWNIKYICSPGQLILSKFEEF